MAKYSPFLNLVYRSMLFVEGTAGLDVSGAQTIIRKEDKVLLIKPTYRPTWEFPGGKIERGEAPETAAIRETKEEARVFIKHIDRKLGTYTDKYLNRNVTIHVFVVDQWEELDLWRPSLEIADRGFFSFDDLPADTSRSTLARIQELLSGEEKEFTGAWV